MTRSFKDAQPTAQTVPHERHPQRSAQGNLRGTPKKSGAGKHNWGPTSSLDQDELDLAYSEEARPYGVEGVEKVRVVKPEDVAGTSSTAAATE
ncbi:hypothetical protein HK104_004707 [Borealophlyctis nickersoniae]|nr:hypothetical protein HK104_004707 [Borealophlyctis nickersoniae]